MFMFEPKLIENLYFKTTIQFTAENMNAQSKTEEFYIKVVKGEVKWSN